MLVLDVTIRAMKAERFLQSSDLHITEEVLDELDGIGRRFISSYVKAIMIVFMTRKWFVIAFRYLALFYGYTTLTDPSHFWRNLNDSTD